MNESEKMLEIIHENCRKEKIKKGLSKKDKPIGVLQMEQYHLQESLQNNTNTVDKKTICIFMLLIIAMLISYAVYNELSIKKCMNNGSNETFCRYAGE